MVKSVDAVEENSKLDAAELRSERREGGPTMNSEDCLSLMIRL